MPDHYDALETRDPAAARARAVRAAARQIVARAMTAPGWARHLAGVDPKSVTSRAALAKLPVLRKSDLAAAAERQSAVRRLQCHAARQGQAPAHVARADLRAGRPRRRLRRRGARAVRRRLPRRRHRAQFVFLSPDARRLHPGGGRACARLRRHSRRRRQHRAATRRRSRTTSRPAMSARRTFSRSCSTPRRRPARTPRRSSAALVSGAALPARCAQELGQRGVAVLQCYAIAETGVIAYESEAREGMIVNETIDRRDRAARHRRSGGGRRGRRGRGHLVQSGLSDDPARHRRPVGGAGRALALRPHQHAHQGLDGPRRPDHQGQGHVRASRAGRRDRRAPSRARRACGSSSRARGRAGRDDAAWPNAPRPAPALDEAVAATLQSVTKLKGAVKLVAPGTLPNDGKVIADERPVG